MQIKWSSGASWRPKLPSDDLNFTAGHPWDDQTYFPWTWVWLWEPFPLVLKCIKLQNRRVSNTSFHPLKGWLYGHLKPSSKARNVLNPLPLYRGMSVRCHTPKKGIFVQSGVQWQHWYIPHNMVVDLMWDAWYGASLSCGIFFLWCQFVKIGFRMKVHWFMTTKLLLCVTYNLHKFKIHIFTPHDWK